ncbi:hypothetical protein ACEPAI_9690 [Sanghuangporus weigelae]
MEGVNPVHVSEDQGCKEVLRFAGSVRLDFPDCKECQIWPLDVTEFSVKVPRNAMKWEKHHHLGEILKKLGKQTWSDFE